VRVTSLRSKVVLAVLPLTGRKARMADGAAMRQRLERGKAEPFTPPARLGLGCAITRRDVGGWPVFEVRPKGRAVGPRHVLYLHGGAYVSEIVSQHWDFVGRLARRLGATVVVPIYPLAPRSTHRAVLPALLELYRELAQRVPASELTVMGDSAGAGLTLALAQLARDAGLPQPKELVLLSPWVDLATDHPDVLALEPFDPMLGVPGLQEAGRLWADGEDLRHPLLSPLYADLRRLGRLSVFTGTRDLLNPDARRLRERAAEQGVGLEFFEFPEMVHDWMVILWLPEARQALDHIVRLVERA
jgi:acetyl esterase/lipase